MTRKLLLIALGSSVLSVLITIAVFYLGGWLTFASQNRQAAIHEMGSHVMPFDLDKTTHVFQMAVGGGVQQVISKDPNDEDQIALIQMHLEHEAMRFSSGDFSDPTALHGEDMPGLKELTEGADLIAIQYRPLPEGGEIIFTTQDVNLVTALHRWFGAQLSDHGKDAVTR
jgi:hypothetical protein